MNYKLRAAKHTMMRGASVLRVVGLLLLSGIGISYSTGPATSPILKGLAGLDELRQALLVNEGSVSQTRDGVTVTVQQVYADANQVMIGYKVTGADGKRFGFEDVRLNDGNGNKLLPISGMGTSGPSNISNTVIGGNTSLAPGEGVEVLAFDASRIQGAP